MSNDSTKETTEKTMQDEFNRKMDAKVKDTIFNIYSLIHSLQRLNNMPGFRIQESDETAFEDIGVKFIKLTR